MKSETAVGTSAAGRCRETREPFSSLKDFHLDLSPDHGLGLVKCAISAVPALFQSSSTPPPPGFGTHTQVGVESLVQECR
jgi:hypothetical protein